ncbi:Pro-resilin-like 177 [Homarus americanus]|uniref:Pro-resilin-like 177 n=2 Tax=Homarus americanus TaxID=6706 RepID=A0A8J5MUF7_HOMAM|nr:Pro-resilin-like 177 [Homarus americanus]
MSVLSPSEDVRDSKTKQSRGITAPPNMAQKVHTTVQIIVLAALVVVTLARPDYVPPSPVDPPRYDFNYAVKDYNGNDFGHQESRDGYNTEGNYYVQLPDGRLERVNYYVNGDSGFVAQVEYEGEAQYPAYQPSPSYGPSPSYQPEPSYG